MRRQCVQPNPRRTVESPYGHRVAGTERDGARLANLDAARAAMLVPQNHELTTQDAAALLNVSRPFVIKEIEAGRLKCRKVGRHRRIEFEELRRYQAAQRAQSEGALQKLADLSQDLGMGY
jgi:excisionase family DNA binding protein